MSGTLLGGGVYMMDVDPISGKAVVAVYKAYQNVPAVGRGNVITILYPSTSQASTLKVRYAWKDNPITANVRSLSGLPMSSFELIIQQ